MSNNKSIDDCVRDSLHGYFRDLDGEEPNRMYDMLVRAVENRCWKSS